MPARIIAIEGIDQSGKRTQTRLLANKLRRAGAKVAAVSFPIYISPAGRQIRLFLAGRLKYPDKALHMLYSLNRWENLPLITKLASRYSFVVANRYTPSNLAYGISRGLSLNWLRGLDTGLPQPDLVIVLDVPVHSSFARKTSERDVHESNEKLLTRVRRSYRLLAGRLRWEIVDATRPPREVHDEIWAIVSGRFKLTSEKGRADQADSEISRSSSGNR